MLDLNRMCAWHRGHLYKIILIAFKIAVHSMNLLAFHVYNAHTQNDILFLHSMYVHFSVHERDAIPIVCLSERKSWSHASLLKYMAIKCTN